MAHNQFEVPILMLLFNRPNQTRIVFDEIKKVKPLKLFLAADGPRTNKPGEIELCKLTRDIVSHIDWPCEVKTLFRENNLGCKVAISEAIDWFFNNVHAGIIFEDDCVPEPSFFPYCQELLEKYKDNPKVMHISGDNLQQNNKSFNCNESYYFSRVPNCWGWATWKRAWDLYDINIRSWPQVKKDKLLYKVFNNDAAAHRWEFLFDQNEKDVKEPLNQARLDWDGRWAYACIVNDGLCINPRVNLISNIGSGNDARLTHNPNDPLANLPTYPIEIPLQHPKEISINVQADKYTYKYIFNINRHWNQQIRWFIKSRFNKPYSVLRKIYHNFRKH